MLVHGGDIYTEHKIIFGDKLRDFSANINPLGMPNEIKQAIIDNIDSYDSYPDPICRELRRAIARDEKIDEEYIFCSNGAADLIFRMVYAIKPKKALLFSPTFSEYEQALKQVDCNIRYANLSEESGFVPDETLLSKITDEIDIVFICNPNNPTGILAEGGLMNKILQKCKEKSAVLVIDECFMDFVENAAEYSLCDCVNDYENLVILKAFTKLYAMAGLRLGYMLCKNQDILSGVAVSGQPWGVSTVAAKCGIAALSINGFKEKTQVIVRENRELLIKELQGIGIKAYPSQANYILFYSSDDSLDKMLESYGILIRNCKNYRNLNTHFFRIAVKSREDNLYLINTLRIISGGNESLPIEKANSYH